MKRYLVLHYLHEILQSKWFWFAVITGYLALLFWNNQITIKVTLTATILCVAWLLVFAVWTCS